MDELPAAPAPDDLPDIRGPELLSVRSRVWRVHPRAGLHPTEWFQFRRWGPADARFDAHPDPPGEHAGFGVLYGSVRLRARGAPPPAVCVAERYQRTRVVDPSSTEDWLTAFDVVRPLRLLSLRHGNWAARARCGGLLATGPKAATRQWARSIHARFVATGMIDGILWPSSVQPAGDAVVLFEQCEDALPLQPSFTRPLAEPGLGNALDRIAADLGFDLVLSKWT